MNIFTEVHFENEIVKYFGNILQLGNISYP